jgi:hypothetical protein
MGRLNGVSIVSGCAVFYLPTLHPKAKFAVGRFAPAVTQGCRGCVLRSEDDHLLRDGGHFAPGIYPIGGLDPTGPC